MENRRNFRKIKVNPRRYFGGIVNGTKNMSRTLNVFENENKIRKIGGRLENDYYRFRSLVLYYNANLVPLLYALGLAKEENKDKVIDVLQKGRSGVFPFFLEEATQAIEEGRMKVERVVKAEAIAKEYPTREEKEKQMKRAIRNGLRTIYQKIEKEWEEEYKPSYDTYLGSHSKILELCRDTLRLTPSGLEIDVNKFIEFYSDFIEADESTTKKQHQEAADSINKFFNGSVEITQKELEKYFIIECGAVKPNPKSINKTDYARLGKRVIAKGKVKR